MAKKKARVNKVLLKKVKENILAKAKLFDMDDWQEVTDDCGTTCCIGGWALAEKGYIKKPLRKNIVDDCGYTYNKGYPVFHKGTKPLPDFDPSTEAQEILGLTDNEANVLFSLDSWPLEFSDAYRSAIDTPTLKAHIGAARVQHFIETGE